MFNNAFNGYKPSGFNPSAKSFNNVAGVNKTPNSVAGINRGPSNVAGMNKTPKQQNQFASVHQEKRSQAKQVMTSDGRNILHTEFRGIKQ